MSIFWKHYTDEEISDIERVFISRMEPKDLNAALPHLLRGHNIDGRTGLLSVIKVIIYF